MYATEFIITPSRGFISVGDTLCVNETHLYSPFNTRAKIITKELQMQARAVKANKNDLFMALTLFFLILRVNACANDRLWFLQLGLE
jgi:hypothetical protein